MTFKRNQAEEAIWRFMSQDRAGRRPQAVFRTRIKRLLELDRVGDQGEVGDQDEGGEPEDINALAFSDEPTSGRGNEAKFTAFNCFCLTVGMLLLNAGFKQREIVDLLRHIRISLEAAWDHLESSPAVPRQRVPAKDRPNAPSYEIDGLHLADTDVYLLINRVETTEVFQSPEVGQPLIFVPLVVLGAEQLAQTLRERALTFPGHYVIELSILAARLKAFLMEAEPLKRGPG